MRPKRIITSTAAMNGAFRIPLSRGIRAAQLRLWSEVLTYEQFVGKPVYLPSLHQLA
jgi:hypothetical protein